MTVYQCSTCRGVHDTSDPNNMMCPQIFRFETAPQPISPDESRPMWERQYFCPQCPRLNQPRDGFRLPELVEHTASHSSAYLREALWDLRRMDGALRELEGNIQFLPGLAVMYAKLALVRAFHEKDDAAFAAWAEMAHGTKNCPTCTATWKQQAPPTEPRAAAPEAVSDRTAAQGEEK